MRVYTGIYVYTHVREIRAVGDRERGTLTEYETSLPGARCTMTQLYKRGLEFTRFVVLKG